MLLFFVYSLLALAKRPLWWNQGPAVLTKGQKSSNHFFYDAGLCDKAQKLLACHKQVECYGTKEEISVDYCSSTIYFYFSLTIKLDENHLKKTSIC